MSDVIGQVTSDLLSDWVGHLMSRYDETELEDIRLIHGHDFCSRQIVECIFYICSEAVFHQSQEVKYLALQYFEKWIEGQVAEKITLSTGSLLQSLIACVQVASKVTSNARSIEPRHVNELFPHIS